MSPGPALPASGQREQGSFLPFLATSCCPSSLVVTSRRLVLPASHCASWVLLCAGHGAHAGSPLSCVPAPLVLLWICPPIGSDLHGSHEKSAQMRPRTASASQPTVMGGTERRGPPRVREVGVGAPMSSWLQTPYPWSWQASCASGGCVGAAIPCPSPWSTGSGIPGTSLYPPALHSRGSAPRPAQLHDHARGNGGGQQGHLLTLCVFPSGPYVTDRLR